MGEETKDNCGEHQCPNCHEYGMAIRRADNEWSCRNCKHIWSYVGEPPACAIKERHVGILMEFAYPGGDGTEWCAVVDGEQYFLKSPLGDDVEIDWSTYGEGRRLLVEIVEDDEEREWALVIGLAPGDKGWTSGNTEIDEGKQVESYPGELEWLRAQVVEMAVKEHKAVRETSAFHSVLKTLRQKLASLKSMEIATSGPPLIDGKTPDGKYVRHNEVEAAAVRAGAVLRERMDFILDQYREERRRLEKLKAEGNFKIPRPGLTTQTYTLFGEDGKTSERVFPLSIVIPPEQQEEYGYYDVQDQVDTVVLPRSVYKLEGYPEDRRDCKIGETRIVVHMDKEEAIAHYVRHGWSKKGAK